MTSTDHAAAAFQPIPDEHWPSGLDALRGDFAGALNVYRVMAHHPQLLAAWQSLRNHIVRANSLPPRLSEIAILRVGVRLGATYEQAHHIVRGAQVGITADEIRRVTAAEASGFTGPEHIVLAIVDSLLSEHAIPVQLLGKALQELSRQQVLDLIATVGMYVTLAFVVKSFAVPLEPAIAAQAQGILAA
jgi:4-carboxymuconolactone decarboxylase